MSGAACSNDYLFFFMLRRRAWSREKISFKRRRRGSQGQTMLFATCHSFLGALTLLVCWMPASVSYLALWFWFWHLYIFYCSQDTTIGFLHMHVKYNFSIDSHRCYIFYVKVLLKYNFSIDSHRCYIFYIKVLLSGRTLNYSWLPSVLALFRQDPNPI